MSNLLAHALHVKHVPPLDTATTRLTGNVPYSISYVVSVCDMPKFCLPCMT